MDQIKAILPDAYDYLVQRNPNSWSKAFFDLNSKCASFENGIAESFNRAILAQRTKPIITMLEDIRLYIMQRLVQMKTITIKLEDRITPSIRKRIEVMKGEESFRVNLHLKKCMCKLWELSGIPCVHSVAAYLFLNKELDEGVDQCYSQERPKKNRVKARSENNSQVSRVGRQITCSNCYEKRHNRRNYNKEQMPKPPQIKKQPGRKPEPNYPSYASNKGGGRGYRGGRGRARGRGCRSGRDRERGGRGQGRGGRGRGRGGTKMLLEGKVVEVVWLEGEVVEVKAKVVRVEGEMEQILIEKEEKRIADEKAIQEEFDEEAVSTRVECGTAYVQTQESIAQPSVAATETTPKGKTIEANVAEPPKLKKQGRKIKVAEPSAAEPAFRIYHKNRGRSERIFNQKMKKTGFGPNGEGSIADKAFSL
ncbi:pectin lyase-like superfamily protein [Tanacetum coccineum]